MIDFLLAKTEWEMDPLARYLWLLIPAVILGVSMLYRRERELGSSNKKTVLITLRVLAIVILLFLLFEPREVTRTEIGKKRPFLIFVDKSMSMQTTGDEYDVKEKKAYVEKFGDNLNTMTRFDQQKELVTQLQEELKDSHRVNVVGFGDNFSYFSDAVSWDKTDGQQLDKRSRLSESLRMAVEDLGADPISGIVIMSDGNIEDVEASKSLLDQLKKQIHKDAQVHTLGLGSAVVKPDVKLLSFAIPEIVIKSKDTVTFRATFSGRGLEENQPLVLKLYQDGKELETQRKTVTLKEGEAVYEMVLNEAGKFKYKLEIENLTGEVLTENNARTAFVTVKDEKLKILYIEDFPRHDYRKISQFLIRNEALYETRIWLNQAQPDYKQLGSKNKELKQSPVITYTSFDKLWKDADVIFIGNIGARPFESSDFLQHVEKFVEKGGGLVFLAGPHNMPSSYADNEIVQRLMPVIFKHEDVKSDGHKPSFLFRATNFGATHPITRMEGPDVTRRAWKALPHCQWYYRPLGVKSLTKVLIEHPEDKLANENDKNVPIFAVMPYGKGQVFYLGCDEMSRWSYLDNEEYVFNHFMGQLIQNMSSGKVRAGGLLEVDRDQIPLGDEINVTLRLDDDLSTITGPRTVKWSYEDGEEQKMELIRRSPDSPVFEGKLEPKRKGFVKLWLKNKANAQQIAVTGFSRELEANELNRANLKTLSDNAVVLQMSELGELAKNFKDNQVKELKQTAKSLLDSNGGKDPINTKVIIIILVTLSLLLGVEWWLRKRWHLL